MLSDRHILLLDVDGVLICPPDWYGFHLRRVAPELAAAFFEGPFLSATVGASDLIDDLPPFLQALGYSSSPQQFLSEWHEYENYPNVPLWEAVKRLREQNWRVYLATNQECHRTRHLMETVGLESLVDGEFASCRVGHRKPSPEYYSEVTRRLGVEPHQIVFFDDSGQNVAAALEAGWKAYIYTGVDSFVDCLTALSDATVEL